MLKQGAWISRTLSLGQFLRSLLTSALLHAAILSVLAVTIIHLDTPAPDELPLQAQMIDREPPVPMARLVVSDPKEPLVGNGVEGLGDGLGKAQGEFAVEVPLSTSSALASADTQGRGKREGFGLEGKYDDRLIEDVSTEAKQDGASFFGIQGTGKNFVYVVDGSGSMREGDRMRRTMKELTRSIAKLSDGQRFCVIFYNHLSHPMPPPRKWPKDQPWPALLEATDVHQAHVQNWLRDIRPEGRTDPRWSLQQAIDLEPDCIFLMSDGEFDLDVWRDLRFNKDRVIPIHTIAFISQHGIPVMKQIAEATDGQFVYEP